MTLPSYEARWFFPGPVPGAVVDRFWAFGGWRTSMESRDQGWPDRARRDDYLVFAADMGVKVRGEPGEPRKLEFKGLLGRDGPVTFAPGVVGVAERWMKWSWEGDEAPDALCTAVRGAPRSVPVLKRRIMRKLRLGGPGNDEEVAPDAAVDRGVQLELTRVRLPNHSPGEHWTLSFEASPVDAGIAAEVGRNVGPFLADVARAVRTVGAELGADVSRSYPAWLMERLAE